MVLSLLRRGRTAAAIAVLAAAAACGGKDPYAPVAQFQTVAPTFILLPLTHAQAPYGSAIDLRSQLAVRPGLEVSTLSGLLVPNFDVAFDVDSSGGLVLKQPKLVTAAQSVPRTGIQIVSTPFDSLGSAPGARTRTARRFRSSQAKPSFCKRRASRWSAPSGHRSTPSSSSTASCRRA